MHSIVRTAMVSVMLAAAGPEVGEVGSPPFAQVSEGANYLVDRPRPQRCWREAELAGDGARPCDASTCLLWCAIALGALVRGCPLKDVGALCHPRIGGNRPPFHTPTAVPTC